MKQALSPAVLRLVVSIGGVVIAAVSVAIKGVEFEQLIEGGWDAWKNLFVMVGIAVGAALWGWAKKWLADFSLEELPKLWQLKLQQQPFPLAEDLPAPAEVDGAPVPPKA